MTALYPIGDVFHWFCKIARFFATEPLIEQSGCSCKKKSKSKPLPTNKPHEAIQMTTSNYTAAEEASYTQHKRIFDGLGLSKAEAMAAIRN